QLGSRAHSPRQCACVRKSARQGAGGSAWRYQRAHLLPEPRGRADRHRRPLQDERRPGCRRREATRAGLSAERNSPDRVAQVNATPVEGNRVAKIIVVTSGKGGVGKTTSTAAIGAG